MASKAMLRTAVSVCLVGTLSLSACGGSSKKKKAAPDPVTMALSAPGVRTVVIPKQSAGLTVVVPPCGLAKTKQETTRIPPGSNQVVVPRSALDQTVAIQPCMQGAKSTGASTVLLSPGGAGSSASQKSKPPNQLILPRNSNVSRLIVPPCLVMTSSSSGGPSGGPNTVLPGARGKRAVTAPPCTVHMTSSASS